MCLKVSIHAPRGGSDMLRDLQMRSAQVVSIHAPRGGSDIISHNVGPKRTRFNPRSPWGERLFASDGKEVRLWVSIHAPRGGSDDVEARELGGWNKFQSTLPVGGATVLNRVICPFPEVSIHAPRGGSDRFRQRCWQMRGRFNPRSPWGERPASAPAYSTT